jgi:hypothetical protein
VFVELIEFVGFRPLKSYRVKCLVFVGWVDPPEADNIAVRAQPNLPKARLLAQALINFVIRTD